MKGSFTAASSAKREQLDWGAQRWLSGPSVNGANQLAVLEVTLLPGGGHAFHKHPDQEEVLYVVQGAVEQWLGQEQRVLEAGDSVFIPPDVVHASFCAGSEPATFVAILGPCVGASGYASVDVAHLAPWNSLRG